MNPEGTCRAVKREKLPFQEDKVHNGANRPRSRLYTIYCTSLKKATSVRMNYGPVLSPRTTRQCRDLRDTFNVRHKCVAAINLRSCAAQ